MGPYGPVNGKDREQVELHGRPIQHGALVGAFRTAGPGWSFSGRRRFRFTRHRLRRSSG